MNYALVSTATILFALQFLFNQKFKTARGSDLKSALEFTIYKDIIIVVMMLVISKFNIIITPFSLILSSVFSIACIVMNYFTLKAFTVANLSVYSVFSMLGGMLLPFILGVVLYKEELTVFKIACCVLIVVAVLLNLKVGKQNKKAILYYMAVFMLNGSSGVISSIHQKSGYEHTDGMGFMFLSSLISIIISCIWMLAKYKKIEIIRGKSLLYASTYGIFNGVGNLFLLTALANNFPASVQYPLVTGGVMVFSTIISTIRKEKLNKTDYIAAAISFAASVLMAF